jgi:hypothetical protein
VATAGEPLAKHGVPVAEILDAVREFYRTGWECPPATADEIRVHPAASDQYFGHITFPAAAVEIKSDELSVHDTLYPGSAWDLLRLRRLYTGAFLYCDSVVDLDPLSFVAFRQHDEHTSRLFYGALHAVVRLRPLIESAVLLLAPVSVSEIVPIEQSSDLRMIAAERQRRHFAGQLLLTQYPAEIFGEHLRASSLTMLRPLVLHQL